jgi:hypothetical protein
MLTPQSVAYCYHVVVYHVIVLGAWEGILCWWVVGGFIVVNYINLMLFEAGTYMSACHVTLSLYQIGVFFLPSWCCGQYHWSTQFQVHTEGQYEHHARLRIHTDTFSCLGSDPWPSAVSLCPWVPDHSHLLKTPGTAIPLWCLGDVVLLLTLSLHRLFLYWR